MVSPIDRAPQTLIPITPTYVPQNQETRNESQGFGTWIANAACTALGKAAGYAGSKLLSYEADISQKIKAYKTELAKKSGGKDYSELIKHFTKGLTDYIKEEGTANHPFFQGIFEGGSTRAPEFLELLTYHAVLHITEGSETSNVIHTAFEKLYEKIVEFSANAPQSLKSDFIAQKQGDTAMEREKAKRSVHAFFEAKSQELAEMAGLDTKGLAELFPKSETNWTTAFLIVPVAKNYAVDQFKETLGAAVKGFLFDQCIDIYERMVVSCDPSPEEQKKIDEMGGEQEVREISKVVAQFSQNFIKSLLQNESHTLLGKINEVAAKYELTPEDEVLLGKELKVHLASDSDEMMGIWNEAEGFLGRVFHKGLCHLALNSTNTTGTAIERIESYLITLFTEQKYDQLLAKKIAKFQKDNEKYTACELELNRLKKEAIDAAPPKTNVQKLAARRRLQEIEKKADELYTLKEAIDSEMQNLLHQSFRPLIQKLLADMGYREAKELPVPTLLQDIVWKKLFNSVLPEFLMEHYGKLETMVHDTVDVLEARQKHAESIKTRYDDDDLVRAARPYAKFAVKSTESVLSINAEKFSRSGLEVLIEKLANQHDKKYEHLITLLGTKRDNISQATKERLPKLFKFINETIEQKIEDTIEAVILKAFDTLTGNLERLEEENPRRAFELTLDLMSCLTSHLKLVNECTHQQGQLHMYKVDPLTMLEQFEKQGELDPAMPGYALQTTISQLKTKVQELKAAIELEPSREKQKALKAELKTATENLKTLKNSASEHMKGNFFNDFTPYFLRLCGFCGPADIPGPKEYREELWKQLTDTWGPIILLQAVTSASKPNLLNKYLRIIAENINESLLDTESAPLGPLNREDEEMVDKCVLLLDQIRLALPGTLIGKLGKIDEIRALPGPLMAQSLRDIFKNYKLHHLLTESLVKGVKEVEELLEEPLPTTKNEKNAQEAKDNLSDINRFQANAGTSIYSLHEKVMNATKSGWNNFQQSFDEKVARTFGTKGSLVKRFLDKIFRIVFINLLVWPLYLLISIPLGLFYYFYSHKITHHAEHLRKNIVETPIHANVGFQALRRFQEVFPMEA